MIISIEHCRQDGNDVLDSLPSKLAQAFSDAVEYVSS